MTGRSARAAGETAARAPAATGEAPGLLRLSGVSYAYPGTRTHALDDVSLAVHEGEFVSVVGPSGCGKSTLVQAAAGLITGYDGTITFKNEPVGRNARPRRSREIRGPRLVG